METKLIKYNFQVQLWKVFSETSTNPITFFMVLSHLNFHNKELSILIAMSWNPTICESKLQDPLNNLLSIILLLEQLIHKAALTVQEN